VADALKQAGVRRLRAGGILKRTVAAQQQWPGRVPFKSAFIAALRSILMDGTGKDSPLMIVGRRPDSPGSPRERLAAALNDGASRIKLIASDESEGAAPAEAGDSVDDKWVFALQMPRYSDRRFWVVVPRDGKKAYNYGAARPAQRLRVQFRGPSGGWVAGYHGIM
jgi:hypothetical protein